IGLVDQADEVDEALSLFLRRLALRTADDLVVFPIVAAVVKKTPAAARAAFRFHKQAVSVLEMRVEKDLVHLLDDGVQPEQLLVVFTRHGERALGISGARRGHAGGSVDSEREPFASPRRIRRSGIETQRLEPMESARLIVAVELDFEVAPEL